MEEERVVRAILPNGQRVLLPDDLPGAFVALLWEFRNEFPLAGLASDFNHAKKTANPK